MNKFKLKWILMFTIIFAGCSADTPRFLMDCKELADKLKVEYLIQGTNDNPTCTVGTKDKLFGGLRGYHFKTQEELNGARGTLLVQKIATLQPELEKCDEKCKTFKKHSTNSFLTCWRPCALTAGYYEENKP